MKKILISLLVVLGLLMSFIIGDTYSDGKWMAFIESEILKLEKETASATKEVQGKDQMVALFNQTNKITDTDIIEYYQLKNVDERLEWMKRFVGNSKQDEARFYHYLAYIDRAELDLNYIKREPLALELTHAGAKQAMQTVGLAEIYDLSLEDDLRVNELKSQVKSGDLTFKGHELYVIEPYYQDPEAAVRANEKINTIVTAHHDSNQAFDQAVLKEVKKAFESDSESSHIKTVVYETTGVEDVSTGDYLNSLRSSNKRLDWIESETGTTTIMLGKEFEMPRDEIIDLYLLKQLEILELEFANYAFQTDKNGIEDPFLDAVMNHYIDITDLDLLIQAADGQLEFDELAVYTVAKGNVRAPKKRVYLNVADAVKKVKENRNYQAIKD